MEEESRRLDNGRVFQTGQRIEAIVDGYSAAPLTGAKESWRLDTPPFSDQRSGNNDRWYY